MTPGVRVWVWVSLVLSALFGLGTCASLVGEGEIVSALFALLFAPIAFYVLATVGAGAINLFAVTGQVLEAQVSESAAIQDRGVEVGGRDPAPRADRPRASAPATPRRERRDRPEPNDGVAAAAAFGAWLALQGTGDAAPERGAEAEPDDPELRDTAFANAFTSAGSASDGSHAEDDYDGDDW